jgi:hypothetical protein
MTGRLLQGLGYALLVVTLVIDFNYAITSYTLGIGRGGVLIVSSITLVMGLVALWCSHRYFPVPPKKA